MNERIGKAAVKIAFRYLRHRYRRETRIALGVGLGVAVASALAYLASREVPEG
jgi:ABC-type lipoprotein release transport system permease subunit